jgi:hypothetical protein
MRTILPLGALLALSLAGCSTSTGPNDLEPSLEPGRPSMDPGRAEPNTSCADPNGDIRGHHAAISSASGAGSLSVWYSVNSMFLSAVCPKGGVPV